MIFLFYFIFKRGILEFFKLSFLAQNESIHSIRSYLVKQEAEFYFTSKHCWPTLN